MQIEREAALDAMKITFRRLMLLKANSGVRWLGTTSDLVELVHIMWYRGETINIEGQMLNFSTSVNFLCGLLGVKPPRKPNIVIHNVKKRKDSNHSLVSRCIKLMEQGELPLGRFITPLPGYNS